MPKPQTSTPTRPWRVRTVALLVGLALGVGAALWVWPRGDEPSRKVTTEDAADRLLAAWRRTRTATFTAEGTFRRQTETGTDATDTGATEDDRAASIEDDIVVVQRPPDRLTLGFGSWDGVVEGERVHCLRDGRRGAWTSCDRTGAGDVTPIDAAELARLRELVDPADPTYRVSALDEGCFRLRLVTDVRFLPDYGRRTDVCFDAETGAIERLQIDRDGAVDLTVFDRISAEVDATDLAIPPP